MTFISYFNSNAFWPCDLLNLNHPEKQIDGSSNCTLFTYFIHNIMKSMIILLCWQCLRYVQNQEILWNVWNRILTEPFLLFPLLSSPFSSAGLQGLSVLFTWYMPLGIFSSTSMHRECQLLEAILFQASKVSLRHLQSLYAHHTPAPTELVQMPLMGESLLIFPKCLENSLLVSSIILTFSYD